MRTPTQIITTLLLLLLPGIVSAQFKVTDNSKPASRIIVMPDEPGSTVNQQAADLLVRFVKEISGAELPVSHEAKFQGKGNIVIGYSDTAGLTEDGFRISSGKANILISGVDKGALYGVVTLLEQYMGVSYFSSLVYTLDKRADIIIPDISVAQNPAFRHRQTQFYGIAQDPVYKAWMRLEEPDEVFAGNMWVHTFEALMPSDVYGPSHPEYYSYINGEHRPGAASQWCLSNPDVLEIATHRIDSVFKANPGMNIISVSQNDGNFTYCQCPKCAAVDEYEGSPAGSYVHFMNKLAERFPDKQISTLAYLFTMAPPKHVKPLPNVNIMLCDIDCHREVPLTDNATGRVFVEAIDGWSKISDNIFVWGPFPIFK